MQKEHKYDSEQVNHEDILDISSKGSHLSRENLRDSEFLENNQDN